MRNASTKSPGAGGKRRLTLQLETDYATLQEDLQKAAAEYQRQIKAKTAESAAFQNLLQKASADLTQLQEAILELRKERHFLANEVMRAGELEVHLTDLADERNALKKELEETRQALREAKIALQKHGIESAPRQSH